jgi:toxin ParE1/3/4
VRIVWSPQSLRDLDAIHESIAKDSEHLAGLAIARIFSAVKRLIQFPHAGAYCARADEPEIREVIVGRFRVVYRVRDQLLEVATVFRASREFPERF